MINLQTKGKGGAKEKQVKMSSPETTDDLPAENGVTTNKEGPASDKAGEKKAECDYILYHVLPMVPVSLLMQSGGIFLSSIL